MLNVDMENKGLVEFDANLEREFAYIDSLISSHTNMAIAKVNAEALQTYWEVGAFISEKLKSAQWGDHVVSELADYLKRHNPKRRGYGKRTLYNSVRLYETYSSPAFSEIIERLQLSEFVQSQTAQLQYQNESSEIVQSPIAQLDTPLINMPRILALARTLALVSPRSLPLGKRLVGASLS